MTVILLLLYTIRLLFLVAGGHVARYWLTLGACFCAFKYDVFSWHDRKVSKVYSEKAAKTTCHMRQRKFFFTFNSVLYPASRLFAS